MITILSDHFRQRRLDQAVTNLVTEGYEVVARTAFHAELRRVTRRLFIPREERVVLEVDAYGHIRRRDG